MIHHLILSVALLIVIKKTTKMDKHKKKVLFFLLECIFDLLGVRLTPSALHTYLHLILAKQIFVRSRE